MPNAATKAFVLGTAEFSEQDKIAHLLTENRGILKAVAPGALKNKNRFGAILELFTEGEFQYYWKEDRELITLSKGDMVTSYFNTVSDPANIFYFYLISEILLRFVPHSHQDNRIYRLIRALLESRKNGVEIKHLLLYFLIWILRIEGMMFNPRVCHNCYTPNFSRAWMRVDYRGILCPQCRTTENVALGDKDLTYLVWTEKHAPKEVDVWQDEIDEAKLIRTFKNKIEFHGEFSLKTSQYLPQFK